MLLRWLSFQLSLCIDRRNYLTVSRYIYIYYISREREREERVRNVGCLNLTILPDVVSKNLSFPGPFIEDVQNWPHRTATRSSHRLVLKNIRLLWLLLVVIRSPYRRLLVVRVCRWSCRRTHVLGSPYLLPADKFLVHWFCWYWYTRHSLLTGCGLVLLQINQLQIDMNYLSRSNGDGYLLYTNEGICQAPQTQPCEPRRTWFLTR